MLDAHNRIATTEPYVTYSGKHEWKNITNAHAAVITLIKFDYERDFFNNKFNKNKNK